MVAAGSCQYLGRVGAYLHLVIRVYEGKLPTSRGKEAPAADSGIHKPVYFGSFFLESQHRIRFLLVEVVEVEIFDDGKDTRRGEARSRAASPGPLKFAAITS